MPKKEVISTYDIADKPATGQTTVTAGTTTVRYDLGSQQLQISQKRKKSFIQYGLVYNMTTGLYSLNLQSIPNPS